MSATEFRAFRAVTDGVSIERGLTTTTELPDDGALIEVHWSSVNYKDGLASIPKGSVATISPLIPGIDLAGVLLEDAGELPAGTEVLAHGQDIGTGRHGGFAELARVPAEWLIPVPEGLSMRDTMVIGTAGFTAAMSVMALQEHDVTPDAGPVLVTGDCSHTQWGWEQGVEPGYLTADGPGNAKSLAALKALAAETPGIRVLVGHETDGVSTGIN